LPEYLIYLMESNLWVAPKDQAILFELIGSLGDINFRFLNISEMASYVEQNRFLIDEGFGDNYGIQSSKLLGHPILDSKILDIDLSIVIADNHNEEAITLDYRNSIEVPRVMAQVGDDDNWKIIANSFEEFFQKING